MPTYIVEVSLGTWSVEVEAEDADHAWEEAYAEWSLKAADDVFVTSTTQTREVG
jgi:hypothetical protein